MSPNTKSNAATVDEIGDTRHNATQMEQTVTDGTVSCLGPLKVSSMLMRLEVLESKYVQLRRPAQERLTKATQEHLCVACLQPLGSGKVKRGCHEGCYRATLRAIDAGKWTESQRVEEGKLLPHGKCGRKPTNPVSIEASE